jgi:1,2-diacylglycerol 3-alpha-glucosyltransferase
VEDTTHGSERRDDRGRLADGFSREQLIWTPNPVDVDIFRPPIGEERRQWREKHGIPLDSTVVVYVGRLAPEKGLQGLLQGFGVAMQHAPMAILVLVGDGPTRPLLEDLARTIDPGMQRIRFVGRAPIAEVPCWLRSELTCTP